MARATKKQVTEVQSDASMFIATESGVANVDGQDLVFVAGRTLVERGHPLLDACPDYFKPADDLAHYRNVEAATAAPGETRDDEDDE